MPMDTRDEAAPEEETPAEATDWLFELLTSHGNGD